jgi:hypothetical protein
MLVGNVETKGDRFSRTGRRGEQGAVAAERDGNHRVRVFLRHFLLNIHHFTKTGSGQP